MGEVYEGVDQYGQRYEIRRKGGGACLSTILILVGVIALIIFGAQSLIGWIGNSIQSNALPVHDSLRNIQLSNSNGAGVSSDSAGLHITDSFYFYSGTKYGDVDVSVTAKLMRYTVSNTAALTAYGIYARFADPQLYNPYNLEITPTGRWFNDKSKLNDLSPADSGTPNRAIKTGIGATNTLEVRLHGTHAAFFINGVKVNEVDFPDMPTAGTVGFTASTLAGDPPNSISVIFTNLTIERDTQ